MGTAVPASAETYARFDDTPVTVSPTCFGTTSSEAQVAPLADGTNGVRVAATFTSPNQDDSCALTVVADWRNLDTGVTGGQEIVVPAKPPGGPLTTSGYNNVLFATGPGTVVITVNTHPNGELRVTV